MSLRRRLTLLSALAVAVAVVLASVIVYALVRGQLRGQIDDTLRERTQAATVFAGAGGGALQPGPGAPQVVPLPPQGAPSQPGPESGSGSAPAPGAPPTAKELRRLRRQPGRRDRVQGSFSLPGPPSGDFLPIGQLVRADGSVERGPDGSQTPELPVTGATRSVAAGDRGPFFSDISAGGSELRVYTAPGPPGTALQVARPLTEVNGTLADLRLILLLVSLGSIGVAAMLGLLVARGALAPAAAVSGAAEDVARTGDLSRRIEVRGDDELARLAGSFNQMMNSLERSESQRRRLVADASHELRTPLATLRTNIETLGRGDAIDDAERGRIMDDLEAELEDMSGLVADIIELARDPSDDGAVSDGIRLDEVAAAAVERARRRGRGLRFETELAPSVVSGDAARLDRAIWNLLDNAIKWSPEGGTVSVAVAAGRVSVRDDGPGFDPGDLPHAFDRFYRSDEARGTPGSGLGLAIVCQIAEQHRGTARASNPPGGGALVEIELPAGADDPGL
ncbi:MAG: HAMP domain-containing histidine kinase [Solirubrobacterales bacterium]|nr:HAMP domain-containing histidine kinase [Solirubrobacterales bacterium]